MSLSGKLEANVEIDAAADQFHNVFSCRPHHTCNMSPGKIHACDLHEGEWGKEGTVVCWHYFDDGYRKVAKEIIETIDDVNLSITYKVIAGDPLKEYKNFKFIVQAIPKGKGSLVHWTMEYEKIHENISNPNTLMEFLIHCTNDIYAHLQMQQNN
uniref:Bet v I/Major latex protein domain-containing protein n=1 Tax=Manihot esculenta TaxID=3983 RepID=A0A2C9U704_MANES